MGISEEKFNQRKVEAKSFYESLEPIKCPYFNGECIYFNSEGFEHILFKEWGVRRSQVDQYTRLRLIPLAVNIIKKTGTLQELDEKNLFVRQQSSYGWAKILKNVKYYIFVAIIGELRLKVIIKEIAGGQKNFHSVYPSWEVKSDGLGGRRKKFYQGNPETD